MINLISEEQVQALIEQRKQEFKLDFFFCVLTSLNHVFKFWHDGDVSICNNWSLDLYQPEIAKLYGAEYDSHGAFFIKSSKTRKHLYNLFINDPTCMFFQGRDKLEQELQNRGLI